METKKEKVRLFLKISSERKHLMEAQEKEVVLLQVHSEYAKFISEK